MAEVFAIGECFGLPHPASFSVIMDRRRYKARRSQTMRKNYLILIVLAALMFSTTIAMANTSSEKPAGTFAETVRQATAQFKDVEAAKAAGYGLLHGCASGPQEGAMGVHYANGQLAGDGTLDAATPEALLYEPKDGKLQLVGVEYVVIAEDWHASHEAPPVLMGQLFNYVSAPNRYGLPAFYELHVWAWKRNPAGIFADWNPRVSCEEFVADASMPAGHR
jgi:hypothetical protein